MCPTHWDAREFHTSAHLKVGGLEHTEEVEPGEQWRWCLQSLSPSPREPGSSKGGSSHDSSLPATVTPVAIANWAAVAVRPGTLSLQPPELWKPPAPTPCPQCNGGAHKPKNTRHGRGTFNPSSSHPQQACDSGDPIYSRKAHHSSAPGSEASDSSSKAPMTPEAGAMDNKGAG